MIGALGLLRTSEVFARASDDDLAVIADHVDERRVRVGAPLVKQGQPADTLFVVVSGELAVLVKSGDEVDEVARMGPGDIIGEIALVAGGTRTSTVRATATSRVVSLTKDGLERLVGRRPDIGDLLAEGSVRRLRQERLNRYLGLAFPNIDDEPLRRLSEGVVWRTIPSGDLLFEAGDPADDCYVVVSGRLRVTTTGLTEQVVEVGPGSLVGEGALASAGRRSATVRALRDADVAVLPRTRLVDVARSHPRAVLDLVASTVQGQANGSPGHTATTNLVVLPLSGATCDEFTDRLVGHLRTTHRVEDLDSAAVDRLMGTDTASQAEGFGAAAIALEHWLAGVESEHDIILHRADPTWTPWTRRCLRRADRILLVADASDAPGPTEFEQRAFVEGAGAHVHRTLVLLHPPDAERPRGTAAWLDAREVRDHLHVRADDDDHHARVARVLTDRAVALVLGGGGARGFAHLGVLHALDDLDVPVDILVGSSIGAVMAAVAATEWDRDTAMAAVRRSFDRQFDYTFPAVAVLRGRRMTDTIEREMGSYDIEDLWTPYRTVATDLTTATSLLLDRGSLSHAVRCSVSIPGVLPPVAKDGHLLVDGGVLDNLPVGVAQSAPGCGTVIAVDVTPPLGPRARTAFPPQVSGWRQLWRSVVPGLRPDRVPTLMETITGTTVIASRLRNKEHTALHPADLELNLDLKGVGLLDFSSDAVNRVSERGYHDAHGRLSDWLASEDGAAVPRRTRLAAADAAEPEAAAVGTSSSWAALRGTLLFTALDLRHRARRFVVAMVGTAVVFTLLLLMTGLGQQLGREAAAAMDVLGGDRWMVREEAGGPFTSATTLDPSLLPAATPALLARYSLPPDASGEAEDVVVVGGIQANDLAAGRQPEARGEAVIGRGGSHGLDDTLTLGDVQLRIVGEVDDATLFAGVPLLLVGLEDAQAIVFEGRPAATALIVSEDVEPPPGLRSMTRDEVAADTMRPLERPIASINLVRALLWVVAAMIVGAVVYLTSLDRARDIAVLRAVGTSSRWLVLSLVVQAIALAVVAAALAAGLQALIRPAFPLAVHITSGNLLTLPVVAAVVAVVASAAGIRLTLRTDPALAFSGPGA